VLNLPDFLFRILTFDLPILDILTEAKKNKGKLLK